MNGVLVSEAGSTPGGMLLILALVVPVAGLLLAFLAGGRHAERIALTAVAIGVVVTFATVRELMDTSEALVYVLGDWAPPLGIALRADGLSVVMMAMSMVVLVAVALYARADFPTPAAERSAGPPPSELAPQREALRYSAERRAPFAFWTMLLAVWAALNVVFLAGDMFTLYVALELVTFAAVPLVSLDGKPETLQAALRYLMFALAGSVMYLVGTGLMYGTYGTMDIALIAEVIDAQPATLVAIALMTVGLLAKTALFPLHIWLPPAHAGAPAAGSALLSGLVIKGSFFIVVRLWFDAFATVMTVEAAQLLAALGACAIVLGSTVALRQRRLKLMIAYSTVGQIGYLFLMFPLVFAAVTPEGSAAALTGGMLQAISHATAKAAMFMAAGLVYAALGHDRVAELTGVARVMPMTVAAFAIGGFALVGLPPSGGFVAKWLLVSSALDSGQWWWVVVLGVGGLLTAIYVTQVLARTLSTEGPAPTVKPVGRGREAVVLALAVFSMLLSLTAFLWSDPVQIGRPLSSASLVTLR